MTKYISPSKVAEDPLHVPEKVDIIKQISALKRGNKRELVEARGRVIQSKRGVGIDV